MVQHKKGTVALSLGVVSDVALHRRQLNGFAQRLGIEVVVSCAPAQWAQQTCIDCVDCWLVETDDERILGCIEEQDGLLILGELASFTEAKTPQSQARADKRLLVSIAQAREARHAARLLDDEDETEVWVLAASLGGPEALKKFLDALPEQLACSLLYAQHLDKAGSNALMSVIARDAKLGIQMVDGLTPLRRGQIYAIPVETKVEFCGLGIFPTGLDWNGRYQPSISHLLDLAFREYGARLNVIFFSGMGEDGSRQAQRMAENGCQVWAQSPDCCVSDAMPVAVIERNICQLVATPENLAQALTQRFQQIEKGLPEITN